MPTECLSIEAWGMKCANRRMTDISHSPEGLTLPRNDLDEKSGRATELQFGDKTERIQTISPMYVKSSEEPTMHRSISLT